MITGVGFQGQDLQVQDLQVQDLHIQGLQEEITKVGLHLLVEGTTTNMQTICLLHLHNQEVRQESEIVYGVMATTRVRLVEFIQSFVRRFAGLVTWHTGVIYARTRMLV